ncbi:hypothetical protein HAX54_008915, partial [Datura stramonium]|nr:hypothetical protein [Datura stramonium]
MAAGSFYIPKYSKGPLGEDTHFICIEGETIGVADGVGGLAKKGIDSGEYSRQLSLGAIVLCSSLGLGEVATFEAREGLELQYGWWGENRTMARCETIGCDQGNIIQPMELGNDEKSDDPSMAQEIMVPVKTGDVIVMASDGLWDNVHDYELEKLVRDRLVDLREMETFSKML